MGRRAGVLWLVIGVGALCASPLSGQLSPAASDAGRPSTGLASAVRTQGDVQIDGLDLEDIWQTAPRFDQFRQFDPEPDTDPSFRTEFRVAYDEDNLYVFVRAFDAHPDSIMRALTRRDVRGPSDQISLYIDSYNDRRTGFNFHVNPDGVKRDHSLYDDGNSDSSWDGVWDVAAQIDSLGWTAEFQIPLSQLRYAQADSQSFGLGVWRDIERYDETVSWPLYDRTATGLVSQLGQLDGLDGLGSPRRLELTPYLLTRSVSRAQPGAGFDRAEELSVGGDLKFGITSNITVDATINPDFGQVEADPAVLNLTAFETFQRERRPFFREGTSLYQFELNCYIVVDCSTNEGLFYSRRIGRQPALNGRFGDATTPTATPIAAAAKLTGRTGGGLSFGAVNAYTRRVEGLNNQTTEPSANYAVLRAQQDFRDGDAGVSWIGTAVNRSMDSFASPYLHQSAYATGVSFRSRLLGRRFEVAGSLAASRVAGSTEAITATQRSSVHYYQQPGDDLQVDSAATSLNGYAAQLKLGKYSGGITRFETSLVRQSGGFEVNDLGFLRRSDFQDWSTWGALSFQTPTRVFRWAQLNGNHWQRWNTSDVRLDAAVNVNGHMGLHNNWDIHAGGTVGQLAGSHCDRCTRGGPVLRESRRYSPWFGLNADSRRTVVPGIWFNFSFGDEGHTRSSSLSPYVEFRLSNSLRASLAADLRNSDDDAQWFGNFTDDQGATHYSFAHLDQQTVGVNLRVNYTATRDLTFEFYGEPFTSSGTYLNFREVSGTPRAEAYADRFVPYTPPADSQTSFTFSQLRTNAVLRWEYRPGSTLFLVWAHGREAFTEDQARRQWSDDFRDLLDRHPENIFLIKVAYWLNR